IPVMCVVLVEFPRLPLDPYEFLGKRGSNAYRLSAYDNPDACPKDQGAWEVAGSDSNPSGSHLAVRQRVQRPGAQELLRGIISVREPTLLSYFESGSGGQKLNTGSGIVAQDFDARLRST